MAMAKQGSFPQGRLDACGWTTAAFWPTTMRWGRLPDVTMSLEAARRWKANWKAVEEAQRAEIRDHAPSPSRSLADLVALVEVAIRFNGWPIADDAVSLREEASAREAWARLRAAIGRR